MKHKIVDNFLSDVDFDQLVDVIMPNGHTDRTKEEISDFTWVYKNEQVPQYGIKEPEKVTDIELLDPINQSFFCHLLYMGTFQSPYLRKLQTLLIKIDPFAVYRIQANLTLQQKERRRSNFHIDYPKEASKNMLMHTSIFYMNSTNGPTILEDGTEIECYANRLVTFPYDIKHSGVSCTDQPYRVVINFNYFKE